MQTDAAKTARHRLILEGRIICGNFKNSKPQGSLEEQIYIESVFWQYRDSGAIA